MSWWRGCASPPVWRERQQRDVGGDEAHDADEAPADEDGYVDYPEEVPGEGEPAAAGETAQTEESKVAADNHGDEPVK